MSRGFASALAFALAIVILATAGFVAIQGGTSKETLVAGLEAQKTGFVYENAKTVAEFAATDAVVDSIHHACGCVNNFPQSFKPFVSNHLENYLNQTGDVVSTDGIKATVRLADISSQMRDGDCNLAGAISTTASIEVKSANTIKSGVEKIERVVKVEKQTGHVVILVSDLEKPLASINVRCA